MTLKVQVGHQRLTAVARQKTNVPNEAVMSMIAKHFTFWKWPKAGMFLITKPLFSKSRNVIENQGQVSIELLQAEGKVKVF
jgi:hypothetical protein